MVTGIVDHTRDANGILQARLLDLVPGRSGKAYVDWLKDRGAGFTAGIETAALDPFRGYANAIRDVLPGSTRNSPWETPTTKSSGVTVLLKASKHLPLQTRTRKGIRSRGHHVIPDVPHPGSRPTRPNTQTMEDSDPAYFHANRASNGPTEAVNGVIETTRRIARGFRDFTDYRISCLLAAGGHRPYRSKQTNHA